MINISFSVSRVYINADVRGLEYYLLRHVPPLIPRTVKAGQSAYCVDARVESRMVEVTCATRTTSCESSSCVDGERPGDRCRGERGVVDVVSVNGK